MKIVIGCDHAGFGIKDAVKKHIEEMGHEVTDVGTYSTDSCHYHIYASAACKKILDGECELGILICGTGIGMSMAANKHKGIRAACCSDVFSARLTREHNDANMLCFGERVVGIGTAAISPSILSYIVTEFPKDKIAKGFSVYMLLSSASVILGPGLGAVLVASQGWRFMLWICVGICAVVLLVCLLTSRKDMTARRSSRPSDPYGSVGILLFFGFVLCVPSFGQNFGWTSTPFLFALGACLGSLIFLLLAERRASFPILSGSFMKRRVFVLSILALFLTQGLMQANMTNTVVFVNYTFPENTAVSGYAISVMYIGMALGAALLGPLADRIAPKKVLIFSFMLTGIGCSLLLFLTGGISVFLLMASLGVLGFGLGANGTVFLKVCLSGISAEETGSGTGTYGLFRDLAAPFGVAVFVPLFTNQVTEKIAQGLSGSGAAVHAMRTLAKTELLCIGLGILSLLFLPKAEERKEHGYETQE